MATAEISKFAGILSRILSGILSGKSTKEEQFEAGADFSIFSTYWSKAAFYFNYKIVSSK